METLELLGFIQVVEEDSSGHLECLFALIFDRAHVVVVDDRAVAQEEGELDIWRYGWYMQRLRCLLQDVIDRKSGQVMFRYIMEFAVKKAFEVSEVIYGEIGSHARDRGHIHHG